MLHSTVSESEKARLPKELTWEQSFRSAPKPDRLYLVFIGLLLVHHFYSYPCSFCSEKAFTCHPAAPLTR